MTKHSSESHKFIKSLVILICVLILASVVFYQGGDDSVETGEYQSDVTALLMEKRAKMRRSLARINAQKSEAFMTISPSSIVAEKTIEKENPPVDEKSNEPVTITRSGDEVVGIDLDIQKAIENIDGGNIEEALSILEGVLHKDPGNEQALIEVAMVHLLDLKQTDHAISYLERVMDVNPSNKIVLTELVSLYDEQGSAEAGLSYLTAIQAKNPDSPEIAYGIAQLLASQGRDNEAVSHYEKALAGDDDRGQTYANLAEAYSRSGNMEKAIESYKSSISEHEAEIAKRRQEGFPVNFDVERLGYVKVDYASQLIKEGRLDEARVILDEVDEVLPEDDTIMALKDQLNRKG